MIYVGYSGGATMGGILAGLAPDIPFEEVVLVFEPYDRWQQVECWAIKDVGAQLSVLGYVSRIPKTTRMAIFRGAEGRYPADSACEIDYGRKLKAEGLDVTLYDLKDRKQGDRLASSRALSNALVKRALTRAIQRIAR